MLATALKQNQFTDSELHTQFSGPTIGLIPRLAKAIQDSRSELPPRKSQSCFFLFYVNCRNVCTYCFVLSLSISIMLVIIE